MKIMYSLGGGQKPRMYLDACVQCVIPGAILSINEKTGVGTLIPLVTLQYDLRTLSGVSLILGQMKRVAEQPVVHVWDEDKPEPEILVMLQASSPSKEVLNQISGKCGEIINEVVASHEKTEVFTLAEANLRASDVVALIRDCKPFGMKLIVDVREAGTALDIHTEPVARFTNATLKRERPPRLL